MFASLNLSQFLRTFEVFVLEHITTHIPFNSTCCLSLTDRFKNFHSLRNTHHMRLFWKYTARIPTTTENDKHFWLQGINILNNNALQSKIPHLIFNPSRICGSRAHMYVAREMCHRPPPGPNMNCLLHLGCQNLDIRSQGSWVG